MTSHSDQDLELRQHPAYDTGRALAHSTFARLITDNQDRCPGHVSTEAEAIADQLALIEDRLADAIFAGETTRAARFYGMVHVLTAHSA